MPSRKQRRRRQKTRRHEYEYVYVDEEGREVEVDPSELGVARNGKRDAKPEPSPRVGGRKIEPPSWQRVGKRALVLAPVMFLMITFLGSDLTVEQRIFQTFYLVVLFVPFSYLLDRMLYRRYLRQTGASEGEKPKRR